ncbi:MAG: dTDP-4-dehydrorhamnose reductase [Anaerolineae bacterium]
MKILLFGKNGQLGWEARRTLASLGEVVALGSQDLDLTRLDELAQIVRQVRPDVIFNAAAYTAVDKAESEPDLAMLINAKAPGVMAEEARKLNAVLIHYSTDYVFDGKKGAPYIETDPTNPLNVYGQSKLAGEQVIGQVGGAYVILRTSWVYSLRGSGFVSKVLEWSRKQETLRVVNDQVGSPTWARMLAEVATLLVGKGVGFLQEQTGLYHLAGDGSASRLEWAQTILEIDPNKQGQMVRELLPALTADFPTPAERPLFSVLSCSKFVDAFDLRIPDWKTSLKMAMELQ